VVGLETAPIVCVFLSSLLLSPRLFHAVNCVWKLKVALDVLWEGSILKVEL
jgi:hypothetical protein